VRLVLDRNGIKRMSELVPETVVSDSDRVPSRQPATDARPVTQ
jgi:hypothetical protein